MVFQLWCVMVEIEDECPISSDSFGDAVTLFASPVWTPSKLFHRLQRKSSLLPENFIKIGGLIDRDINDTTEGESAE